MPAPKNGSANPHQETLEALASKGRAFAANATKAAADAVEAAHGEAVAFLDVAIEVSRAKSPEQAGQAFGAYFSALGERAAERAKAATQSLMAGYPDFLAAISGSPKA